MGHLAVPHNSEQIGVADRLSFTLCDLFSSMLEHREHRKTIWAEALNVAAHVGEKVTFRKTPTTTSPYELLFGQQPDLGH